MIMRSKVTKSWDCSFGGWNYFVHVAYLEDETIQTTCIIGDSVEQVESRYEVLRKELSK